MGTSTTDSFDGAAGVAQATPGSYGEAPRGCRLPDATRLGPVRLQIAYFSRSLAFYEQVLGLRRIAGDSAHALLAAHGDDRVLVELVERAGARPTPLRGQLALYHFAAAPAASRASSGSARGANTGTRFSRANFTFHGHTSWEACRNNRFEIPLSNRREPPSKTTG